MKRHLFNLIVYLRQKSPSKHFQQIVQAFTEKYPCKALFIQCGSNAKDLEVTNGGDDTVTIKVPESLLYRAPFVLLPRLISDLPIYLVWGENPTAENEILPALQKIATRFVYDSEEAQDLIDFTGKMLEKITELKIDFMDISWASVSGWRDAIAETFHSPEKLDYLSQCNQLVIKYNTRSTDGSHHPAIQAIYLQGWLAAQLGWKFEEIAYHDAILLKYSLPKATLNVSLVAQDRATIEGGKVFELEFQGLNQLNTTLSLAEKQSKITVYLSTPEKCELPFSHPIPDMSKGLTAMKEVFYYRASQHYINMLKTLATIPWKEF